MTETATRRVATPITYPARPMSGGSFDKNPLILPGRWSFSPKVNGWRALVNGHTRQMWNRHGQPLTIQAEFKAALDRLEEIAVVSGIECWDCEALDRRHNIGRGCLIVLDWVPATNYNPATYSNRACFMGEYLPVLKLGPSLNEDADKSNWTRTTFPLLSMLPSFGKDKAKVIWDNLKSYPRSVEYSGRAKKQFPISSPW